MSPEALGPCWSKELALLERIARTPVEKGAYTMCLVCQVSTPEGVELINHGRDCSVEKALRHREPEADRVERMARALAAEWGHEFVFEEVSCGSHRRALEDTPYLPAYWRGMAERLLRVAEATT